MARFMPAETYNPRTRLAAAIEARTNAETALKEAISAESDCFGRLCDARDSLLDVQASNAAAQDDGADAFIAARRCGADCGVDVLEAPSRQREAELDRAQREVAALARTQRSLEETIPIRQRALDIARTAVEDDARAVIAAAVDVPALIEEAEQAADAIISLRARLAHALTVTSNGPDRSAAAAFLARPWLISEAGDGWKNHEAVLPFRLAQDALVHDANAPVP